MTKTTSFFKKHTASADDVTNTYAVLQWNFNISSKIRLLAISAYNGTNPCKIDLFVTPSGAGDKIFLKSEAMGADYSLVWSGSMILDSVGAIGAVFRNPVLADSCYLRIIWEEI